MNKTIFVSIASYRDIDVTNTIEDLFSKANNPNDIYVGLYLQDTSDERGRIWNWLQTKSYYQNIKFILAPYEEAKGCGWSRNIILEKLYNNEDYFLCVDSHSRFLINWDTEYINKLNNLPSKGVISVFPQAFEFEENYEIYSKRSVPTIYYPNAPIWSSDFKGHCQRAATLEYEKVIQISGGNLFGPGEICNILKVNEYYNPSQEQEIYSLLLFKSGYDIYAISKNIVWHKYIENVSTAYRKIATWGHFNPIKDFIIGLENYGGTERTTTQWLTEVYKECSFCEK